MVASRYDAVLVHGPCAACGAGGDEDALGCVVFRGGEDKPEPLCRTCWGIICVSSAAKLRELADGGVDIAGWAAEALQRAPAGVDGQSVPLAFLL